MDDRSSQPAGPQGCLARYSGFQLPWGLSPILPHARFLLPLCLPPPFLPLDALVLISSGSQAAGSPGPQGLVAASLPRRLFTRGPPTHDPPWGPSLSILSCCCPTPTLQSFLVLCSRVFLLHHCFLAPGGEGGLLTL